VRLSVAAVVGVLAALVAGDAGAGFLGGIAAGVLVNWMARGESRPVRW
jgi:fructose-specific phosphotransferase system IIC component